MLLSVIIVNYNAKYFLEQCLCSLERALKGIESETILIDNHSSDGSMAYLQPKFPSLVFVSNPKNLGFSKANNQGLSLSKGQYILFLNPDTIVSRESVVHAIEFLKMKPKAGALGFRMIDGSGKYLPESKRGFPFPSTAFFKLFGIAAIFPKSKTFASYYLGHVPENETHPADVISGACMFLRRKVLEKTGGFDEAFFMYGEDIDLSYRIQLAGFTNYYMGSHTILHFKGESTLKDPLYIDQFYRAMVQFIGKWFKGKSSFFNYQLRLAIAGRKRLTRMNLFFHKNPKRKVPGKKYALKGDELGIEECRAILLHNGREIEASAKKAQKIIFCEGPGYSFAEIIRQIQAPHASGAFYFHALHSQSIVGSQERNKMGESFSLQE